MISVYHKAAVSKGLLSTVLYRALCPYLFLWFLLLRANCMELKTSEKLEEKYFGEIKEGTSRWS